MSASYQDFFERLREERLRLELSQSEISQQLRMSQSLYSKVELGTGRLTYYEIQCLCELNADVRYIFTGDRCEIEEDISVVKYTFEELVCYLNIICALISCLQKNGVINLSRDMQKKVESIQYVVMPCERGKTLFYKLRRALNYNQMKMANLLGVDVKKLRSMESGKILPDSEIIWCLSERFFIPYALVLHDKKGLACEISYLLKLIEKRKRKDILNSINSIHDSFY